jgi:hypothetical protein
MPLVGLALPRGSDHVNLDSVTADRPCYSAARAGVGAIMTFPGAGMYQQPSSAQAVGALPAARDEAASYQAHGEFLRGGRTPRLPATARPAWPSAAGSARAATRL